MNKYLIGICTVCLLATTAVNADRQPTMQQQSIVQVQIINAQLNLTKQSFKSIQVVNDANGRYAVDVELSPDVAKQLQKMTAANINKIITIVWDRYTLNSATIKSPLDSKFLITGLNQKQAQAFVQEMKS